MGQGDVCPPAVLDYVAFANASGSISKMAVVRRQLPRALGRYLLGDPIAAGGMAAVHLGRIVGPAGFSRTVAIKRMHAVLADRPELVSRFVDEAKISARVRHPNVVQTLDAVSIDGEVLLVLEYVHGESLARLRRAAIAAGERLPLPILSAVLGGVLRGLHAAHEATSAKGAPLEIVHRDVSPQNVLVGTDGAARVLDFGVARAEGREAETLVRSLAGKLAYMAPEQLSGEPVDRRCDVFAAGVVLWETLAQERLFRAEDAVATMDAIFHRAVPALAGRVDGVTPELDALLARALAKSADERFTTADEMGRALQRAVAPASERDVGAWVERLAGPALASRALRIAAFEQEERAATGSETRMVSAPPSGPLEAPTRDAAFAPMDAITADAAFMPVTADAAFMPVTADDALMPVTADAAFMPVTADAAFEPVTQKRASPIAPAPAPALTPVPTQVLTPVAMAIPVVHEGDRPSATRLAPAHLAPLRDSTASAPPPRTARARTKRATTLALIAAPPVVAALVVLGLLAATSRSPRARSTVLAAAPPAQAHAALPPPAREPTAPERVTVPVVVTPPATAANAPRVTPDAPPAARVKRLPAPPARPSRR